MTTTDGMLPRACAPVAAGVLSDTQPQLYNKKKTSRRAHKLLTAMRNARLLLSMSPGGGGREQRGWWGEGASKNLTKPRETRPLSCDLAVDSSPQCAPCNAWHTPRAGSRARCSGRL